LNNDLKITKIISDFLESNVFVVEKQGHCLIVDSGANLNYVAKVVGDKIVDAVLLTHGHYDHSIYCQQYASRFNSKIYAYINIKDTLSDGEANYSEGNFEINDFSNFVFIEEDCKIKIGVFDVECITSEGHSPCSICYKIGDNLFAGDFLFENGIGRTDLIGSNKKEMIKSLEKFENIDFENVFSGHGDESDKSMQEKNIKLFKRFLTR